MVEGRPSAELLAGATGEPFAPLTAGIAQLLPSLPHLHPAEEHRKGTVEAGQHVRQLHALTCEGDTHAARAPRFLAFIGRRTSRGLQLRGIQGPGSGEAHTPAPAPEQKYASA